MSPVVRRYWRVPREDGATYIHPTPGDLPALVERTRRLIASWDFQVGGRPFREFRAAARAEILLLARQYAERWGFAVEREWSEPMPLIATGHQPPPFHPGVWIKNFLAGSLASAVGGAALNLVVDNDEARGQAYRFPARAALGGMPRPSLPGHASSSGETMPTHEAAWACHPAVAASQVQFAPPGGGLAFEEQAPDVLRAEAIHAVLSAAPAECAEPFRISWKHLITATPGAASLGEMLAVARRKQEEQVGLRNYELPISQLADSKAFRLFVAAMLLRHEELFAAYNDSLAEYRRAYRERSAAQPVPDLARDGRRIETPFWVWRSGERRRRLWVEARGDGLVLSADREEIGDAAQVADLRKAGWKIRPRVLSMTLFVRMVVADTFIHGLGGALYDQITDGIFERLFRVRPPEMVLASCTVRLPLKGFPATERDLARALRAMRDWRYNPDRMMGKSALARPEARVLIEEKRRLIASRGATREDRRRAFLRIHEINDALAALEPDGPRAAARDLQGVRRELGWNAVIQDREYPFCFHDPGQLAKFYRTATAIERM